jgi:hypothetical protein
MLEPAPTVALRGPEVNMPFNTERAERKLRISLPARARRLTAVPSLPHAIDERRVVVLSIVVRIEVTT